MMQHSLGIKLAPADGSMCGASGKVPKATGPIGSAMTTGGWASVRKTFL